MPALVLLLTVPMMADPPQWDPARTTSPETVAELRAQEALIQAVHAKALPSVVGILVGPGAGSGVIVREDGLVLTAAHVVGKPGVSVRFVLPDGTVVRGRSLGLNPKSDTALARITDPPPKGDKWPAAPLGKGADLKKGQWVIALGHSGGPKPDRPPVLRVGRFETLSKSDKSLRTTCILIGGDNGGPLLDLTGKVVGVHSRIGLFLAYNMHVPVEEYEAEWEQLLRGEVIGKTDHADLGLEFAADKLVVAAVTANGPADKAGVRPGDVVTRFDSEPVATPREVTLLLSGKDPGQRVEVEVRRGEEMMKAAITLGKKPTPETKKDK